MENKSVWTIRRIIPINISNAAIVEQVHIKGMNSFFIIIGFGIINKYKKVMREMQQKKWDPLYSHRTYKYQCLTNFPTLKVLSSDTFIK